MASTRSYRQQGAPDQADVVVVGSGLGGLVTASLLARHARLRPLVLERHTVAGGYTHAFKRRGFDWDVGVHYLGDLAPGSLFRRVFDHVTDGELQWADLGPVYDRVVVGDRTVDFPRGRRQFRNAMADAFPRGMRAVDGYLARMAQAKRVSTPFFLEKTLPAALARLSGPLLREPFLAHAGVTTGQVLDGLTDDPVLRAVLTAQWGDCGLPPGRSAFALQALITDHYLDGAYYPVGGAARIADTIVPGIEQRGGAVRVEAEVAEILVEGARAVGVRMADGREIRARHVISDAGVFNTLGRLVHDDVRERFGFDALLQSVEPSTAHAALYVGVDGTAEELGLPRHNLWLYPNADHDGNYARFGRDPSGPLPVAFVSFPSARDPDFARRCPGKATIKVVTMAPWPAFERWSDTSWRHHGQDYEAFKQSLHDRMLDALLAHVPQIRGRIVHAETSTPLSTRHFAGFQRGETYGLAHDPNRFRQAWLRCATPIDGLWLTGVDVTTAGVASALWSGVLTASALAGRDLLGVLGRQLRVSRGAVVG